MSIIIEFLSSYTKWLLGKSDVDEAQVSNFGKQIDGVLQGMETALSRVRSNRSSLSNLSIISREVGESSEKMSGALTRLISSLEQVKAACIATIQKTQEKLGQMPGADNPI
jgi:methyl-accepting chemotaxis protein